LILFLFTASYPYDAGAEQTFLDIEIQYLQEAFGRVILVPRKCQGKRLPVPDGVEVAESYSDLFSNISPVKAFGKIFFSASLYREIRALPWLLRYPSAIKRLFAFLVGARMTRDWITEWFATNDADPADCLFYTYWFDQAAYGIGLVKQQHPQLKMVSRVHGYDLYEEVYYDPPYWPRRKATLSLIDRLFPDAQAGFDYLNERYPDYASVYEPALLGVSDPGFVTPASTDDVFRIVSCSMLEAVKRVDLLLEGIAYAAAKRPEQQFEWRHFGNGESRLALQDRANNTFPANARGYLPGYSTKEDLMRYYESNPVDVFVNVSASEGTPVSVMEAISCGIPVIATTVGGNVEIALEKNGLLLDPDTTPEQIGEALLSFWDDRKAAIQKRQGSREVWMERYNADANFRAFAEKLNAIRQN
jgi:glycosyltransferase involved in cell wall biosynthesis